MEYVKLGNTGLDVSRICLGCMSFGDPQKWIHSWVLNEEDSRKIIKKALDLGINFFDTANVYGLGASEEILGRALKDYASRDEIVIATKISEKMSDKPNGQGLSRKAIMQEVEHCLERLQTDYIDLYLIHMPYGDYHGSWRALEELYKEGKIKAIGVCNFLADRLVDLILTHDIVPAINQMELHPFYQQKELKQVMLKYDIQMMAWAPFAEGNRGIFTDEQLQRIGSLYQKTPAQVILRWLRQNHIIAIPKSIHEDRMIQNYSIDDFELSQEDMLIIEKMDENKPLILEITALNEVYRLHGIQ